MHHKMGSGMCTGGVLVLMAVFLFSNSAQAAPQNNSNNASKEKISVVAHLPLPGSAVRQIFFQQENGKQYVYLQQSAHFTVVDVSDPKNPRLVDRVASGGKLTEVGAGVAIAVQSDQSAQASVPTQTIRLVDVSDPKNPHTAKKFDGVTSVYSEDGRQLIYITNSEGLWIIKHYETFRLPLCTSESEENSVAQCQ
jgi:endonuclease YncB( thermonuclease family)